MRPEAEPRDLFLTSVEVTYERVYVAAHAVNVRVPSGSIVAVLGANGAGKTTVLRGIAGFLRSERAAVTNGQITYGTAQLRGRPPASIASLGISLVPEREKVFTSLSVAENLEVGGSMLRSRSLRREMLDLIHEYFPVLRARAGQKAGYLSGGERQMLAVGRALMGRPSLLMVDELSMGLAPLTVSDLMHVLKRINREQGTSILFVEQSANDVFDVADYVYIMESGTVALEGSPAVLTQREDVQELYLGVRDDQVASYADVSHRPGGRRWNG